MRILFIILVLGNISFFIWQNRFVAMPERAEFVAVDPGVAKLELLSELRPGKLSDSNWDNSANSLLADASQQMCFSVGPFAEESALQPVLDTISPLVLKTRIRKLTTTQEVGYWVYLPALASRDEALKAGRALAAANVRDYYVVTSGDHENTVSLGLYRQPYNADNRIAELQSKGFEAKQKVRLEQWPEFWLDYSATESQMAQIPDLTANNAALQQNNVRCER